MTNSKPVARRAVLKSALGASALAASASASRSESSFPGHPRSWGATAYDITTTFLTDDTNAILFPYPQGRAATDYLGTTDHSIISQNGADLRAEQGDFTLTFNPSSISVTLHDEQSYPAGTRLWLHLEPSTADTRRGVPEARSRDIITPMDFGAAGDGATDDTAAVKAAIAALEKGQEMALRGIYLVPEGDLIFPGDSKLSGPGTLVQGPTTLAQLLRLEGDNITVEGVTFVGNMETQKSPSSISMGIYARERKNLRLLNNTILGFTRHGIMLDGVEDVLVQGNYVEGVWNGAGILCSDNVVSKNVRVVENTIRDTQHANIHAYLGVDGWLVESNHCDGTDKGNGDDAVGGKADNITCYPYNMGLVNAIVRGNVCKNSGNHGIHVGGIGCQVTGNTIIEPWAQGIYVSSGGTTQSAPNPALHSMVVSDNIILGKDRNDPIKRGIDIRNIRNFVVTGNVIANTHDGINVRFEDEEPPSGLYTGVGTVVGNSIYQAKNFGVCLTGLTWGVTVLGNEIDMADATGQSIRLNTAEGIGPDDNQIGFNGLRRGGHLPNITAHHGTSDLAPTLRARGADTHIHFGIWAKNSGLVQIGSENGVSLTVGAQHETVVNHVRVHGAAAGNMPTLQAAGQDPDQDLILKGSGTGLIRHGKFTVDANLSIVGFREEKTEDGTIIKVAVVG